MSNIIRPKMHAESGLAYDADGLRYDVTAWRKALLLAAAAGSSSGLSLEATQQLVLTALAGINAELVTLEDYNNVGGLPISRGDVTGASFIHKFGNAPDFDTTDGIVSVWDGADDADINQMVYSYSTTADIDRISTSSGTGTQNIEIQGLDASYNKVTQTKALTAQTPVALGTPLMRVFRMKNIGTVDNTGHVYCFVNTAVSSGTPTDKTKIRAAIQPLANQTLMALYTVPAGCTGYLQSFFGATAGASRASNYVIDFRVRPLGQVFQLKNRVAISDTGTSHAQHVYHEPEVIPEKSDIEMRVEVTAVGVTGASISSGFDIVLEVN